MNDKSNIQPRAKIMWYFEPRIERKKSRYRSTFLVRLLGSKYFIILALVGYLLYLNVCTSNNPVHSRQCKYYLSQIRRSC